MAASLTSTHWMPVAFSHPQLWPKMSQHCNDPLEAKITPMLKAIGLSRYRSSQRLALRSNSTTNCPCQGPAQEWGQMPLCSREGKSGVSGKRRLALTIKAQAGQAMWICIGKRGMPESEALKTTSLLPQHWAHLRRSQTFKPKETPAPPEGSASHLPRTVTCPAPHLLHVGLHHAWLNPLLTAVAHLISVDKQGNQSL